MLKKCRPLFSVIFLRICTNLLSDFNKFVGLKMPPFGFHRFTCFINEVKCVPMFVVMARMFTAVSSNTLIEN